MTGTEHIVRVAAIVPAAGVGRRMGCAKQALVFGRSTLTGTVVQTLLDAGVDVLVLVTRTSLVNSFKLPDDPRVRIAINDDPETEMIDSVRVGLHKLSEHETGEDEGENETARTDGSHDSTPMPTPVNGILVLPGDMPNVSPTACRACLETFRRNPSRIVIATHERRRGHPIVIPWSLHDEIERINAGLNQILDLFPELVRMVETGNPGILRDVDTPEDFKALQRPADECAPDA